MQYAVGNMLIARALGMGTIRHVPYDGGLLLVGGSRRDGQVNIHAMM
jgi:hypothetical protein